MTFKNKKSLGFALRDKQNKTIKTYSSVSMVFYFLYNNEQVIKFIGHLHKKGQNPK